MLLSTQPGDTGVLATATSSRLVLYDLRSMSPVDFFSTPWCARVFGDDALETNAGRPAQHASMPSLSTQALHGRDVTRPVNFSAARAGARQGMVGSHALSATEHSATDFPAQPYGTRHGSAAMPYSHRGGEAGVSGTASGTMGCDALAPTCGFCVDQLGPALPPRLVIDLRASAALLTGRDASFAGSVMATTTAGQVPPASAGLHARGAENGSVPRPAPPPSSAPSQDNPFMGFSSTTAAAAAAGARRAGRGPPVGAPHVYSQYTGSLVNNSFLSASGNSASGGGGVLADPVSLSLSCGTPHFQIFLSDTNGSAWIGASNSTTITRIHVRHRRPPRHQPQPALRTASSHTDVISQRPHNVRFGRDGDGETGDGERRRDVSKSSHSDNEEDEDEDEEGDNNGDVGTERETNGGSSGLDVNAIMARPGAPTAVFPSRVTASGWDPRSATTLALGRYDGVVQLLDVEYLVGNQRGGGSGADLLSGASGPYLPNDDLDDDGDHTELADGQAPRTTTYAGTSSRDAGTHPQARRHGTGLLSRRGRVHHTYLPSGNGGGTTASSATRIEYSTVQQCQLEGPVTALDWVPSSHSAVVASRRQSGLGFSMRLLDLRTADKGTVFGGEGDVLCCAEKIACDPSQRFVATAASESDRDVVQLWDLRLTTRPLTSATYARVGYTSLCWTGTTAMATLDSGGNGPGVLGVGGNTITLLGVTRRGTIRIHDFTEDTNGFPLMDGALPPKATEDRLRGYGGGGGGDPARRARSLLYTRCSLDEDLGDVPAPSDCSHLATTTSHAVASTAASGHEAGRDAEVSAPPSLPAMTPSPQVSSGRAVTAPVTGKLAVRLPTRVPASAVAWVAAPLPAHPTHGDAEAEMDTACTPGVLIGRGSRMNLPLSLLLHAHTGELYTQVYNRYGSVATVASVSGHVLVAAGPNTFWTNVALHRGQHRLLNASADVEDHKRAVLQRHDDRGGQRGATSSNAHTVPAGDRGGLVSFRLTHTLTRAQMGFSSDPLRNLAVLLDEGADKETFVLFRYGVTLSRCLFPLLAEDGSRRTPASPSPTSSMDGEDAAEAQAEAARRAAAKPPPPVPIGQTVPGMLELINAEWRQREYLDLLDVPLSLRADDTSRAAVARNAGSGPAVVADLHDGDDAMATDDDYDYDYDGAEEEDGEDADAKPRRSRTGPSKPGSAATADARTSSSLSAAQESTKGLRRVDSIDTEDDHDDDDEGDDDDATSDHRREQTGKDTQSSAASKPRRGGKWPSRTVSSNTETIATATSATATAMGLSTKVTLPNLRLFRGRPLAVVLPGLFLSVHGAITTAASPASPRDALLHGGGAATRHLYHHPALARPSDKQALPIGVLGTAGGVVAPSGTNTAPPPPGLAAPGSLRRLLLVALGWRRSAVERATARAAAQARRAAAHRHARNAMDDAATGGVHDRSAFAHRREAERIGQYFVEGDGVGVGGLQDAVERRVAVLVLQDRLREASEVVAHYSDCHPLYPTLALEISAAGMAAAAGATGLTRVSSEARRGERAKTSSAHTSRADGQKEMEKKLRYMQQRTTGCTFWMSLALTYIDMIVLQRPPTSADATKAVVRDGGRGSGDETNAHGLSPSLKPQARGSGRGSSRVTSPKPEDATQKESAPVSRQLSPSDLALPFATQRYLDETATATATTAAPTGSVAGAASDAARRQTGEDSLNGRTGASTGHASHTDGSPHVGLSHLAHSAQPAFFLKLLTRFPLLPVSDQLGMAVALLLPPHYTAVHLQNLRDVLQTLCVRQYNASFQRECALLEAAGGGAAVIASMQGDRRGHAGRGSGADVAAGQPARGGAGPISSAQATLPDVLDVHNHPSLSTATATAAMAPTAGSSAGNGGHSIMPPLHPRDARATASTTTDGEVLVSGSLPSAAGTPCRAPSSSDPTTIATGRYSPQPGSATSSPQLASPPTSANKSSEATTHTSAAAATAAAAKDGGPRLLLAAAVEGMRGALQRYVDMTGEVQTPLCYATAFGPTRTATYQRWREAYRGLLNEAGCYLLRSQHDLCCVKTVRSRGGARPPVRDLYQVVRPGFLPAAGASSQRFHSLLLGGSSPFMAGRSGAPQGPLPCENPHRAVELRCNCGQAMHATSIIKGTAAAAAASKAQIQQIPCGNPECRQRQTPMCTVCGERMEHKLTELSPERSFTWCTTCLHGGHWCHLREWFTKHNKCPVEECLCECGGSQDW